MNEDGIPIRKNDIPIEKKRMVVRWEVSCGGGEGRKVKELGSTIGSHRIVTGI